MWYDLVVKLEYHALFHIVFFHIVFWTFFLYLSVLKNTNSRHTVQPAIPNTALTDYIILSFFTPLPIFVRTVVAG